MKVLGLDTATTACSAAVWADGQVLAARTLAMERGHAEALMPMIVDALAEARCGFAELDLLAVTVGPGAFTGLRVGLAAARGMAIACALPCVGVTTLEAVAAAVEMTEHAGRNLLVALRSRRAELYVQGFDGAGSPLGPASAVLPSELVGHVPAPVVVVGDASADAVQAFEAAGVEAVIADAPGVADPGNVAAIAALRWASGEDVVLPAPLYLRPPDAIRPRNGGRLRP